MKADTARHRNMQHSPDVYGFEGEALSDLTAALVKAGQSKDATLLARMGRKPDGTACMWFDVKVGGQSVAQIDTSWNCPPRPPEDCEE